MSSSPFRKSDSRQGLALYFLFFTFFVIAFSMTINQAVEIRQIALMQKQVFSALAPHECAAVQENENAVVCPLNQSEDQ